MNLQRVGTSTESPGRRNRRIFRLLVEAAGAGRLWVHVHSECTDDFAYDLENKNGRMDDFARVTGFQETIHPNGYRLGGFALYDPTVVDINEAGPAPRGHLELGGSPGRGTATWYYDDFSERPGFYSCHIAGVYILEFYIGDAKPLLSSPSGTPNRRTLTDSSGPSPSVNDGLARSPSTGISEGG